jgi:enterobacterial common antigen flippase
MSDVDTVRIPGSLRWRGRIEPMDGKAETFRHTLRSSLVTGGASVATVLLGMARTKVLALWVGVGGVGVFGALNSLVVLVGGIATTAITSTAVREIAESHQKNDVHRMAHLWRVVFWLALVLGIVGTVILAGAASSLALATFGTDRFAWDIRIIATAVFLSALGAGKMAVIQGLRQIAMLARVNIVGAGVGTVLTIIAIWAYRERGIAVSIVLVAAATAAAAWWYSDKVRAQGALPSHEVCADVYRLLRLSAAFVVASVATAASAYAVRVLIISKLGIEAAGFYQAAWTVAGVYVGFVLAAMAADYYPRLAMIASDDSATNRAVNEQTEAALLMALPGVVATITLAPFIIRLLYSNSFLPATDILRWQALGVLGRVISWPVSYVLLARGHAVRFVIAELIANILHAGFAWMGIVIVGLAGAGMAFAGMYIVYTVILFVAVNAICRLRWTAACWRLVSISIVLSIVVFLLASSGARNRVCLFIGVGICIATASICLQRLMDRSGFRGIGDLARLLGNQARRILTSLWSR